MAFFQLYKTHEHSLKTIPYIYLPFEKEKRENMAITFKKTNFGEKIKKQIYFNNNISNNNNIIIINRNENRTTL